MQLQSEFWIAGWEQRGEGEGGQKGWEAGLLFGYLKHP